MRVLILFRHLPTKDDVAGIYTPNDSSVDFVDVNNTLIKVVQSQTARFIFENNVRNIFCSNNKRGVGTADKLLENVTGTFRLHSCDSLNNINQPEWANKHYDVVKASKKYDDWLVNPESLVFDSGDSLEAISNRLDDLLQTVSRENTLIISHSAPTQVLICKLLGVSLAKFWSFKFDYYKFTAVSDGILLANNCTDINSLNISELRSVRYSR